MRPHPRTLERAVRWEAANPNGLRPLHHEIALIRAGYLETAPAGFHWSCLTPAGLAAVLLARMEPKQ